MITPIYKQDVWLLGFAFVSGANAVHTTSNTMIAHFQDPMTCWNSGIQATSGLIDVEKTHWF